MGGRTPPKRPEERLGHPKRAESGPRSAGARATSAPAGSAGGLEWPRPDRTWLARTKRWYLALAESGQSTHYQPSDVAHAVVMASILDDAIRWKDPALYRIWERGIKGLMTTELDRRIGRMELAGRRAAGAPSTSDSTVDAPPSTASVVDELAAARVRLGG